MELVNTSHATISWFSSVPEKYAYKQYDKSLKKFILKLSYLQECDRQEIYYFQIMYYFKVMYLLQ